MMMMIVNRKASCDVCTQALCVDDKSKGKFKVINDLQQLGMSYAIFPNMKNSVPIYISTRYMQ